MKDTYTYQIGENLYINLTNRCSNRCTFCVRNGKEEYEGHALWIREEPTAAQVIGEIGDASRYDEVVFCGFGEPTYRLDAIPEICTHVHKTGGKTRLNTNGHGSLIHGKNIAPLLKGQIDAVNISLNAPTEEAYVALCKPRYAGAFGAMLAFARDLKAEGISCWFSVVDCIGAEKIAACEALSQAVGIPLRVRAMIE